MRILVYPHDLTIGGSQINAIDLAASVQALGHEVMVYGIEGPLVSYIEERGLRFIPAHRLKYRPAPSRIAQLAQIAAREKLDLIHAYEWPPCLDAYYGAGLLRRVPILCTVLGMTLPTMAPASVPLIMGTAELGAQARAQHKAPVWVIEPPIDTERDDPKISGAAFRAACGVLDDEMLVVTVSRLSLDLKIDALVRAIEAAALLADRFPFKLVLVGGGQAAEALRKRAAAVNKKSGREVVRLHGEELDPRPAYAAADLVLGMGSSSLRAMSMRKPVIIQGERGFSEIFSPQTQELFLWQGLFGIGDDPAGVDHLAKQIAQLLGNPDMRRDLADFGHKLVTERFSLARATQMQIKIYEDVLKARPRARISDVVKTGAAALAVEIRNHDPRQKRKHASVTELTLKAAQGGDWPPKGL